jgi:uncharacterized iron-regulated protein
MDRTLGLALAAVLGVGLGGCARTRCCDPCRPVAAPAAPVATHAAAPARASALYDGLSGEPARLGPTLADWKDADLVAFGELHGDPVGAATELEVLKTLQAQGRPLALAMEFLERDVQPTVDAYLQGKLTPEAFMKKARQGQAYPRTHGPLIDFCKAHHIDVIAANAPRRLVSAYRKQDEDYDAWRASLPKVDRGWLPEETTVLQDEYRDRFMKLMGKRGKTYFRAQSLWDDAMAESIVNYRAEHPEARVMLVVGAFHVQEGLGTITKYKMRRGKDDLRLLVMTMDRDPSLPFREEERGLGDLVLVVPPPKHPPTPKGPNPHRKHPPAKHPATKGPAPDSPTKPAAPRA